MDRLNDCIKTLDAAGLDVLDVGCQWQEKTPATLADSIGSIAGVLIMLASAFLLWAINELARKRFKSVDRSTQELR